MERRTLFLLLDIVKHEIEELVIALEDTRNCCGVINQVEQKRGKHALSATCEFDTDAFVLVFAQVKDGLSARLICGCSASGRAAPTRSASAARSSASLRQVSTRVIIRVKHVLGQTWLCTREITSHVKDLPNLILIETGSGSRTTENPIFTAGETVTWEAMGMPGCA